MEREIENHVSMKTTHKIIKKLIDDKKVIIKVDENNSQLHHLFINEENTFIKITKQLSKAETFIKKTDQYIHRLFEALRYEGALLNDENKPQERILDLRRNSTRHIELIYTTTITRILDDLSVITMNTNLPEEESKAFLKKIVKLKTKVAQDYYKWDSHIERTFLNSQIREIKQWENGMKSQKVLEDYTEKKRIEIKLSGPLKEITDNFIKEFLT